MEWDLLLREIVTSRPKKVVWEDPKEIVRILNMVGKTHGLNHTFLPSGGGLDLHGAKHYSNNKVELDFEFKIIIQPKLLQLNLYEDAQWNHFYLETDDIILANDGDGNPYSGQSFDEYSQFDEDTYVERWRINYPEFNGVKTPDNARIVTINHHGNFVIFPKISFYNTQLDRLRFGNNKEEYVFDPYNKLHDKFETADQFAVFLETMKSLAKRTDDHVSVPLSLAKRYGRNVTRKPLDPVRQKKIKEICRLLENHNFRSLFEDIDTTRLQNGEFQFEFHLSVDLINFYFLNFEYRLVKKKTEFSLSTMLEDLAEAEKQKSEALLVQGFEKACKKIEALQVEASNIKDGICESIEIDFFIRARRTTKLDDLGILDENNVRQVLSQGNDDTESALVLGPHGDLILINAENFSREICPYSALLFTFEPHMNILGTKSDSRLDEFINDYYSDFLAITLGHLETGRFVESFDDTSYHTIEELKKLIIISNEKYPESIIYIGLTKSSNR
ncbi:MAG: hypothetical protein K8R45_05040 [Desulfobacterales bacterium]|nr:hypothetical protein [Desulfobacterales bacterium]